VRVPWSVRNASPHLASSWGSRTRSRRMNFATAPFPPRRSSPAGALTRRSEIGKAGTWWLAVTSRGEVQMQFTFACGRYLWTLWMMACSVYSLPRLCVPKFPNRLTVVCARRGGFIASMVMLAETAGNPLRRGGRSSPERPTKHSRGLRQIICRIVGGAAPVAPLNAWGPCSPRNRAYTPAVMSTLLASHHPVFGSESDEDPSHRKSRLHRNGHGAVSRWRGQRRRRRRHRPVPPFHFRSVARVDQDPLQGRARDPGPRPAWVRCGGPPRGAVERSAGRSEPRPHLPDQPPRLGAAGRTGQGGGSAEIRLRVLVQQLRRGGRRAGGRGGATQSGHRLRRVQGAGRARRLAAGGRLLLPPLLSLRPGLRRLSPAAVRRCAQQPGRPGLPLRVGI